MRSVFFVLCVACSPASSAPPPGVTPPHAPVVNDLARRVTPPRLLGDAQATGRVIAAHVVASVDGAPATDRPAHARLDQPVTLYAAIVVDESGKRAVYSDAPALVLAGKRIAPRPLARAPQLELRWNRIEPAVKTMTNGDTPSEFHFAAIDYRATPIDGA